MSTETGPAVPEDGTPHQPPGDAPSWRDHWASRGQPWRREPEIAGERQAGLLTRLQSSGTNLMKPPFEGVRLTRADVEWLLAPRDGWEGPIDPNDGNQRSRPGLRLDGADLSAQDLSGLPLARVHAGSSTTTTTISGPNPIRNQITRGETSFQGAILSGAVLSQAMLMGAHFEGALLHYTRFEQANLQGCIFAGAELKGAIFDKHTRLYNAVFSTPSHGGPQLADVQWNGVNLAVVRWDAVARLRDEWYARGYEEQWREEVAILDEQIIKEWQIQSYADAGRAYRQLAAVLREQGVTPDADRFSYRAHLMQRKLERLQKRWGSFAMSLGSDWLAGYGYRADRSFRWYAGIILASAIIYFILEAPDPWWNCATALDALAASVTTFHGRGFFPGAVQLTGIGLIVSIIEAVFGLFIEVAFIVTFTQRFFGK